MPEVPTVSTIHTLAAVVGVRPQPASRRTEETGKPTASAGSRSDMRVAVVAGGILRMQIVQPTVVEVLVKPATALVATGRLAQVAVVAVPVQVWAATAAPAS